MINPKPRMENARYDNLYETQRDYNRVEGYINQYKERLPKYQEDIDKAQNNYEAAKTDVDKAKKTLATAKKAKDEDLIEMANSKLEKANSMLDYYKDAVTRAKSELRVQERNIKELEDKKSGIETYWQKQGVKDVTKINEVLEESANKRQEIEKRIEGIKDQREQFIKEATEQLMAEKNKQKHLSVEEVVNQTTKDIKNNLRVMDDELKAEIKAELEERYPHLKKSLPLFFIKNGRFLIRR